MRGSFSLDAVVIGGGPGGSIAALLLARLGWSVALIERRPRNRGKTCGHCLSPRIRPLLASLGLMPEIESIAVGRTAELRVHLRDAAPIRIPLTSSRDGQHSEADEHGLVVERSRFDQCLIDRAIAEDVVVFQPASARVSTVAAGGAVLEISADGRTTSLAAELVVGADGLRSSVARAAGMAGAKFGRKYGFSLDVPCLGGGTLESGAIHMFVEDDGYLGVVNQGGTLHLAALVGRDERRGAGRRRARHEATDARDPLGFCSRIARRFPVLAEAGLGKLPEGAVQTLVAAGPMPCRPDRISQRGFALVGDAAGYIEPFTGEGMSWAIESASALAEVAADCRRGEWNEIAARRYTELWRRRVGARHRMCRWISLGLERPHIARLARTIAGSSRSMTRRVVERVVLT